MLESELLVPVVGANNIVKASVASHPDIDADKISNSLTDLCYNTMDLMPYLTQGDAGGETEAVADREKAVQQFLAIKAAEEKNKATSVQTAAKPVEPATPPPKSSVREVPMKVGRTHGN